MAKREVHIDPEILAPALIDAINIFCRDVLVPGGLLSKDAWEDDSLLEKKYAVACMVAERWSGVLVEEDSTDAFNDE